MGTTRITPLRTAGVVAASALTLTMGLSACSSSDGDASAADTGSDGSTTLESTLTDSAEDGPADLVALLPGQQAFGEEFHVTRVSAEDFANTMQKAQAASDKQTSDPPQCKSVLDTAGDLDPDDSAIEVATNKENKTTMAVITTHADTTLDTVRTHLDDCGSFTMSSGELTEKVDVEPFTPAGADGQQAIGLTRTEAIADKAVRTTVIASNVVDGVGIQIITQQPSAKPLPDKVIEHFQETSSGVLQTVADKAAQN